MKKRGLIYCPSGDNEFGFTTPTPILLGDTIRIYGGVRDKNGVSRIKYVDVAADNPRNIIKIGGILLSTGNKGCFDDNGVILGDLVQHGNEIYMYYVGFQHVQKVKFCAFSGVAISHDGGERFERYAEVPVMDRTTTGRYGRCIHSVFHEDGVFKIYYAVINDWKIINEIPYPVYDIWYTESKNGLDIPAKDDCLCVTTNEDEYRIGRPRVYKTDFGYEMFYTRDFISKDYVIGYATSVDGINWTRDDDNPRMKLLKSDSGWDSEMACYPVKLQYKDKTYIFYNGNGMGLSGVGYAEID